MSQDIQNIKQLMAKVESVIDLEQIVQQTGIEFSDYTKYLKWLDSTWERLSAEKRCAVFESILAETALPSRLPAQLPTMIVESGGVEYHLHGVVHGLVWYVAPGWQIRRNVKEYISTTINSFHHPTEGEDYVYEENFQSSFDLLYSQELRDVTCTMRESNLFMDLLAVPTYLFAPLVLPIVFGAMYIHSKMIWKPQHNDDQNSHLSLKSLTDERYQKAYADFCSTTEMPQPFNLEKEYLFEKKRSWSHFLMGSALGYRNLATGPERSLWTARSLQRYASSHNLHILHYLCGGGHTTEIAYFLEHHNFSFERLEEYRLNKK